MTDLPNGWAEAPLSEIIAHDGIFTDGDWVESKDQDPNGSVRLIQLADIADSHFVNKSSRFLTREKAEELNCTFLEKGDLLVARMPDPLGRCCIFPLDGEERFVTVVDICAIRLGSASIEPRYLMRAINSPEVRGKISALQSGSTRKRISRGNLASIAIPIPSINEQRRIVEKIETFFDEIDKGVESLQAAKITLGLYRQSLLKAAFEGRLTADWREKNADKLEDPEALLARIQAERENRYKAALNDWQEARDAWRVGGEVGKKPAKPKRPNGYPESLHDIQIVLPELPFGWRWGHLGWCSLGPKYGTSAKSSDIGEMPVVRMGNLQRGRIDWERLAYTSDQDEIEQYSLKPNDVLFNRTNSPELVGKTSIYKGERPAIYAGYLVRVNQIEEIASGAYVTYFLNSPVANEYGKSVKTDGVNQSNINATKLQEYPFPYCGPSEQAEIVSLLDEKLDAADALESEIDAGLSRAVALRQSILKKAFSGQLVSQDPTDEPASELLARIKVEKAEKERATKRERKTMASRKPKTKVRRPILSNLIEVLKKQNGWISASKAAQELGVFDGATSDDVEAFYRQLKEHLDDKDETIEVERRGDEDWLRLTKAEVS
ncbi:restriction endonuclease subunit S [Vreelandella alkaliphila]|uniref:restriction endonuclease subunit S n=1 Tax=Vreelandella alkaliphila TaxID=272774 RepID=UPI003FD885E7